MNMERLVKELSDLYSSYGYLPYAMSKFEEYGLYLRNKDFLISDRVLTFTDTDGKLMALKPDVTLSIVKNTTDVSSGVQKVYYRENVYRPGKDEQGFREILQIGLECMGAVDLYSIFEVLLLAAMSLMAISDRCVLDISHMGLVSRLLDEAELTDTARKQVLEAIGSKNIHDIRKICGEAAACGEKLITLTQLTGKTDAVISELEKIFTDAPELTQLKELVAALDSAGADCVNLDFSVVNDMNYYNGIVFRGFVEGIPEGVLSGGQYDGLMEKMKRTSNAIGFALYPDLLERLFPMQSNTVDAVLYYDRNAEISVVADAVAALKKRGISVQAQPGTGKIADSKCYRLVGNEVKAIENHA